MVVYFYQYVIFTLNTGEIKALKVLYKSALDTAPENVIQLYIVYKIF